MANILPLLVETGTEAASELNPTESTQKMSDFVQTTKLALLVVAEGEGTIFKCVKDFCFLGGIF